MWLPMNLKVALGVAGIMLGAIALIRAAIWLPLFVFTPRTWLHLAIGLAPLFFLRTENRQKYLCYVALLAGAGGSMLLGASYFGCSPGDIFCAAYDKGWQVSVTVSCYIAMLGVGFWQLRKLSRHVNPRLQ
jgi:hypothetical protein